jgi:hypothetical protein
MRKLQMHQKQSLKEHPQVTNDARRHAAWLPHAVAIGIAIRERRDGDAPTEAEGDNGFAITGKRANERAASMIARHR